MSIPKDFLNKLAESPLGKLKIPLGPRLKLDLPEDSSNQTAIENTITFVRYALRTLLEKQQIELPDAIRDNQIYKTELLAEIPPQDEEPKNPKAYERTILAELMNILPFSTYRFDDEKVTEDIDEIAKSIINAIENQTEKVDPSTIEKAQQAIRLALVLTLRRNLEKIDEHLLFRADIYKPDRDPLQQNRFSSRKLRKTVRNLRTEIDQGTLKSEEAPIILLLRLNIINTETYNSMDPEEQEEMKTEIFQDMQTSLNKAWQLYEEIGKRIADLQDEFDIEGERVRIDPNADLKCMNIFELLNFLLNNRDDVATIEDYNEAQGIAYLAYLFFLVRKHPNYQEARTIHNKTRARILKANLFKKDTALEEVKLYQDEQGNIVPNHDPRAKRWEFFRLRKLKRIRQRREERIHFEDVRIKSSKSIVTRLLLAPDFNIEDVPDLLAGRVVLWDIQTKDFSNEAEGRERMIEYLEFLAYETGKALGLNHRSVSKHEVQNGTFCVENKLDKAKNDNDRSTNYKAMKVYGMSEEGVRMEVQIVPSDIWYSSQSKTSPNNHRYYEARRDLALAKIIFRGSAYPRLQAVAQIIEQKLNDKVANEMNMHADKAREVVATHALSSGDNDSEWEDANDEE